MTTENPDLNNQPSVTDELTGQGTPDQGTPEVKQPAVPETPESATPPDLNVDTEDETPEPTGDNRVDVALRYVAGLGIKATDPEVVAAKSGDFTLLEAKLKVLGDKAAGWEAYVGLAKDAYRDAEAAAKAKVDETAKAVYAAVGGEAEWGTIRAWAAAAASPQEKEEVNAALAAGGIRATAMAKYLAETYSKVHGKPPAKAVKPNAGAPAQGNGQHITAKEFGKRAAEFIAKANGRDPNTFPEYRALVAQRSASRRAGVA